MKLNDSNENVIKNLQNIPSELKNNKHWVTVQFGRDKKGNVILNSKGKPNKEPFKPNGYHAKPNDSRSWSNYDHCLNTFKNNNKNNFIKGLGYMLSLDDDYVFIDIDNIEVNKKEKMKFINSFNSYTELSQSKKGYHIIVKVDFKREFEQWAKDINLIDYGENCTKTTLSSKNGDYEVYIEKRFFWLTGDIVNNKKDIKKISYEDLRRTYEFIESKKTNSINNSTKKTNVKHNNNKEKSKVIEFNKSPVLTNQEIITLCNRAKNKDKFIELWNEEGKQGNSETDQSLMNILAFYTQDVEQLCDLMLESPRYRDKFDNHPTYLERSANKAIRLLNGKCYKPSDVKNYDVLKIKKQGAKLPDDMKSLPWIIREINEITGKTKVTILCPILAEYLNKNGKYIFVRDNARSQVQRYLYKNGCYRLIVDDEFKGYIKKYIPLELQTMQKINEVMNLIYTNDQFISYDKLNPEHYINFKNGLFNIKTWKMEEHTPEIYSTIQIPCDYNPMFKPLKNSVFDKFLSTLTENNENIKKLLKQFMGVTISNVIGSRMKKAMFMVGKGDTGKSQIKELLVKLIGKENNSSCDLQKLEKRFGTSSIYHKRLAGSNDMGFMTIKELKVFKDVTGKDTIDFEFKNETPFSDKYYGVFWFCCNELPKFGGDKGEWTYKRMVVVKCNNVIPEEKQDSEIVDKMYEERDYIIWQIMNSLKQVIDNKYKYDIPTECIKNLEEYMISNDSVLSFLEECTEKVTNDNEINKRITVSKMYKIYKKWCEDNNNGFSETKQQFNKILDSKKIGKIKKTNGNRYYVCFKLNNDCLQDYNEVVLF